MACRALLVALLFLPGKLFAQEPAADGSEPAADTQAGEEQLNSALARSVQSMFQEKESPFLHIRWGTKIFVDAPIGNEPEGADLTLRKAELKLSRSFGKHFQIKVSGNYDHGEFKAGDSYWVYSGWKSTILTVGVQDPPYSLEASSTSSATTFMEESLPVAALSENKNAGVDLLRRSPTSIFNASWVFYNPRVQGASEIGQAIVARYVYSPIDFRGRKNLHLGGSFSYRFLKDSAEVQFKTRPEIATSDVFYINTGNIDDGKEVMRLGVEASQIRGRFSWQTELLTSRVSRDDADTVHFWGTYFHVSQFLTDDSRNYDQGSGDFDNVVPNSPLGHGGWGAWELAFRASYADLTDKDIIGGRESNLSFGLNWYLNEKIRFMANAVKVLDVDRPGSEYDGIRPWIFALRAQWLIY